MPETLLDVRGLRLSFGTEEGTVRALFGVSFSVAPAETVGLVGESGCGKTVTALSVLRLLSSPPAVVEGGDPVPRRGPARPPGEADVRGAGKIDLDDLPGADVVPEPRADGGGAGGRGVHGAQGVRKTGGRGAGGRVAPEGRHARSRTAGAGVPPPVERRDAAAGDDRDGARPRAGAPHRRRADHGARRDDPGADPLAAAGAAGAGEDGGSPHHPRPRRGARLRGPDRDHVPRPHRGDRADAGPLRRPRASVHAGAAGVAAGEADRGKAAGVDPRDGSRPVQRSAGVPVRRPVPVPSGRPFTIPLGGDPRGSPRRVRPGRSAAVRVRPRALCRVPPPAGGAGRGTP